MARKHPSNIQYVIRLNPRERGRSWYLTGRNYNNDLKRIPQPRIVEQDRPSYGADGFHVDLGLEDGLQSAWRFRTPGKAKAALKLKCIRRYTGPYVRHRHDPEIVVVQAPENTDEPIVALGVLDKDGNLPPLVALALAAED